MQAQEKKAHPQNREDQEDGQVSVSPGAVMNAGRSWPAAGFI
jgi:hypothetical protein